MTDLTAVALTPSSEAHHLESAACRLVGALKKVICPYEYGPSCIPYIIKRFWARTSHQNDQMTVPRRELNSQGEFAAWEIDTLLFATRISLHRSALIFQWRTGAEYRKPISAALLCRVYHFIINSGRSFRMGKRKLQTRGANCAYPHRHRRLARESRTSRVKIDQFVVNVSDVNMLCCIVILRIFNIWNEYVRPRSRSVDNNVEEVERADN